MDNHFKITRFIFWQRWLFFSSILFALLGITYSVYGNNILMISYNKMLATIFWKSSQFPDDVETFRAFIYGPLGATIACCYILLAYIAYYPFKEKQLWARNAIILAFSVWVLIDSFVCIQFGVYPQVYIINLFSIIVKALPIIFTWNDFKYHHKDIV
jgi:hypothetical protein